MSKVSSILSQMEFPFSQNPCSLLERSGCRSLREQESQTGNVWVDLPWGMYWAQKPGTKTKHKQLQKQHLHRSSLELWLPSEAAYLLQQWVSIMGPGTGIIFQVSKCWNSYSRDLSIGWALGMNLVTKATKAYTASVYLNLNFSINTFTKATVQQNIIFLLSPSQKWGEINVG